MTMSFEDLPFDKTFYRTKDTANFYENWYNDNSSEPDSAVFVDLVASNLGYIEIWMALCGVLVNVAFAFVLIAAMISNRGNKATIPRLLLIFGMLVAHTVYLVFLPVQMILLDISVQSSDKALCIFMSSIFVSSDCTSIFITTLLSSNMFWTIHFPVTNASRRSMVLWTFASFAAWIVGFGIGFGIGVAAIDESQGHCGGNYKPFYLAAAEFIITFLVPYALSIALTCLTIIKWRKIGYIDVQSIQYTGSSRAGQVDQRPEHDEETSVAIMSVKVDTCSVGQTEVENQPKEKTYDVKGKSTGNTDVSCISATRHTAGNNDEARSNHVTISGGSMDIPNKSLKFWINFGAVNVFMSFLCRLCMVLPIADLIMDWNGQLVFYAIVHLLLLLYYLTFPFVCLIPMEVRKVFKRQSPCCKIVCWCCNCCFEGNEPA